MPNDSQKPPAKQGPRKAIGKRLRFEVFKRDNFTCQYCGAQAPDVVLHIDHINPVAGGGANDLMNLITSCKPCNLGKGAKTLGDKSTLTKQRAQLEELSARRGQLEMMLKWRQGLSDLGEQQIDAFNSVFSAPTGCSLSEHGRASVKSWLKRYSLNELIDGLDAALDTYYKGGSTDPDENNRLAGVAFGMTVRVLAARKRYAEKPHIKDLFYIRACIRNRMYCNEKQALILLERAFDCGIHTEELKEWALTARSWTNWRNEMEEWIEGMEAPK